MKTIAALALMAASGVLATDWSAGDWHTIAAYDAENQLIARALGSEANYASGVTTRLCVDRTFAIQEHIVEGESRQLSYHSWGCEMPAAGGQCATREPRGPTCTTYDVSIIVDLKTNGVRVTSIIDHSSLGGGGRGNPPSMIPTTRPPSTPETTSPSKVPSPSSPATSTPATTAPATTTPPPTTPAPTIATVAVAETTTAASDAASAPGSQSEEAAVVADTTQPSPVPTTAKPTTKPTPAPTPAPTKSAAASRAVTYATSAAALVLTAAALL